MPIFGWCDNYNLWITSPNGTKTMLAMVSEFTIHPKSMTQVDEVEVGVMSITIPRLKKFDASHLCLMKTGAQMITHFKGNVKSMPPDLANIELSPAESHKPNESLVKAKRRDAAYYSQLHHPDAIEFSGYNAKEDHKEDKTPLPKTLCVFGPLL